MILVLASSAAGSSSLPCWQPATECPRATNFANSSQSGGLMSNGINRTDTHRQAGVYAGPNPQGRKAQRSAGRAVN